MVSVYKDSAYKDKHAFGPYIKFQPIIGHFVADLSHVQTLADEKVADERARNEKCKELDLFDLGPQPEMIDDFIRNYFANMGLNKTLAQVNLTGKIVS